MRDAATAVPFFDHILKQARHYKRRRCVERSVLRARPLAVSRVKAFSPSRRWVHRMRAILKDKSIARNHTSDKDWFAIKSALIDGSVDLHQVTQCCTGTSQGCAQFFLRGVRMPRRRAFRRDVTNTHCLGDSNCWRVDRVLQTSSHRNLATEALSCVVRFPAHFIFRVIENEWLIVDECTRGCNRVCRWPLNRRSA